MCDTETADDAQDLWRMTCCNRISTEISNMTTEQSDRAWPLWMTLTEANQLTSCQLWKQNPFILEIISFGHFVVKKASVTIHSKAHQSHSCGCASRSTVCSLISCISSTTTKRFSWIPSRRTTCEDTSCNTVHHQTSVVGAAKQKAGTVDNMMLWPCWTHTHRHTHAPIWN